MYIATLKPKEGELRALSKLGESSIPFESFIPNFIIGDFSSEILTSIRNKYTHRALLDVRDLDADDIATLEDILANDEDLSSQFSVVYPIEILLDAQEKMSNIDYVRIPKESMNGFFLQWLDSKASILPDNIIIDFGHIDDTVSKALIDSVIEMIKQIGNKNIAILSGAIKSGLPVRANENYRMPRYEKELYQKINSSVKNQLIYSDYCTVSPIPFPAASTVIPIVQIKYTLEKEYWFIRNGQRRGNYDFVSVCKEIVSTIPDFDPNYSWGDNFIQSVVDEDTNKGNPSVWASIGINHHIHVCIDEII